jgi:hypothetical protein
MPEKPLVEVSRSRDGALVIRVYDRELAKELARELLSHQPVKRPWWERAPQPATPEPPPAQPRFEEGERSDGGLAGLPDFVVGNPWLGVIAERRP